MKFNYTIELAVEPVFSYKPDAWDPTKSADFEMDTSFLENINVCVLTDYLNDSEIKGIIRGMEVGDDRLDLCNYEGRLELELHVQSHILGMKTSPEDTSISKKLWNFTEVTGILPCAKEEAFDYVRKTGKLENLGFLDCPRLRIILDTRKGNSAHSNSSVGKASMLGRDGAAVRQELVEICNISGFLQDGFLQTVNMTEPKYLPRIMGGCGAGSPFGLAKNLYSYIKCYKHGTYERVYGTSTNELQGVITDLENDKPSEPWFSKRLRDKQEYLHGTYAEFVFVPEQREISSPYWNVPRPIYKEAGTSVGISGVEGRLIRAKRLIGTKAARVLVDQRDRIIQVINGISSVNELDRMKKVESLNKRKKFEGALSANSAFQRLLKRCANDTDVSKLLADLTMKPVRYGSRYFDMEHAIWLHKGGKGRTLSLLDIRESEDMYVYSELSLENSLRISGIPLNIIFNNWNKPVQKTVKKIGLYEISSSQEEWADKICSNLLTSAEVQRPISRLKVLDIFHEDLEWVNDDSAIISKIFREKATRPNVSCAILVSGDKKLAQQITKSTGMFVILYLPVDILKCLRRKTWCSKSIIHAWELLPYDPSLRRTIGNSEDPTVYLDSGSMMSAAVQFDWTTSENTGVIENFVIKSLVGIEREPHRKAIYAMDKVDIHKSKRLSSQIFRPEAAGKRGRNTRFRAYNDILSSDSGSGLTMSSRGRAWAEHTSGI